MTEGPGDAGQPAGLTFPCRYPVKAMCETGACSAVLDVVARHIDFCPESDVRTRLSRNGRFESITVTVEVQTRDKLELLYAELRRLDAVKMML